MGSQRSVGRGREGWELDNEYRKPSRVKCSALRRVQKWAVISACANRDLEKREKNSCKSRTWIQNGNHKAHGKKTRYALKNNE